MSEEDFGVTMRELSDALASIDKKVDSVAQRLDSNQELHHRDWRQLQTEVSKVDLTVASCIDLITNLQKEVSVLNSELRLGAERQAQGAVDRDRLTDRLDRAEKAATDLRVHLAQTIGISSVSGAGSAFGVLWLFIQYAKDMLG